MRAALLSLTILAGTTAATFAAAGLSERAQRTVQHKLGHLASSKPVISATKDQNQRHAGIDQADIDELDRRWRAGDEGLIAATLSTALSRQLADIVSASDGLFTEIIVMDAKGLNVGQSARTSDYWQGDEAKWRRTFLVGPGSLHVSEVEEDESTQTFQVQVSVPIVDGGAAIGALTVGVDAERLERLMRRRLASLREPRANTRR